MAAAGHFRVLLPDELQSLDSRRVALVQLRLADDGAERVARSGLDPTQIDGAARHEIGGEDDVAEAALAAIRSEEHTSELQSLMRISYAVFCLKKTKNKQHITNHNTHSKNTKITRRAQIRITVVT